MKKFVSTLVGSTLLYFIAGVCCFMPMSHAMMAEHDMSMHTCCDQLSEDTSYNAQGEGMDCLRLALDDEINTKSTSHQTSSKSLQQYDNGTFLADIQSQEWYQSLRYKPRDHVFEYSFLEQQRTVVLIV